MLGVAAYMTRLASPDDPQPLQSDGGDHRGACCLRGSGFCDDHRAYTESIQGFARR